MNRSLYPTVSAVIFGIVACLHVLRLIFGWHFQLGNQIMPIWISYLGAPAAGFLCIWGFKQKG